ncbi:MAG: acyl-CoA dehydratase activase [Lachnospiraceae bacterium]|nr:acyl-CoA dehydratase activase [Lachnospiraceae bacterium]
MKFIGIDIGSTAAKVCIREENENNRFFYLPSGWSSRETAEAAADRLRTMDIEVEDRESCRIAATGYGRRSVEYAEDVVTEITCHGRGGAFLAGGDCTVIDVGGQDTKIIAVSKGLVVDFLMNDKCAAGTGKFVELMANRLELDIPTLFDQARRGTAIPISALCTVFAESEVISLIGQNRDRKDIAAGVVDSVAVKVAGLAGKRQVTDRVILTGGLSLSPYFAEVLGEKLKQEVMVSPDSLYAGALGAALTAEKKAKK